MSAWNCLWGPWHEMTISIILKGHTWQYNKLKGHTWHLLELRFSLETSYDDYMHLCTKCGDSALNNSVAVVIFKMAMNSCKWHLSWYFLKLKGRIKNPSAKFYLILLVQDQYFLVLKGHMWFSFCMPNLFVACQCIHNHSDIYENS